MERLLDGEVLQLIDILGTDHLEPFPWGVRKRDSGVLDRPNVIRNSNATPVNTQWTRTIHCRVSQGKGGVIALKDHGTGGSLHWIWLV